MRLLPIFFVLLAFLSTHAGANPHGAGGSGTGIIVAQLHNAALENDNHHAAAGRARADQQRRGFSLPDTSGYTESDGDAAMPESVRRQGRLSLEERRALRRQINEAGNAIYPQSR